MAVFEVDGASLITGATIIGAGIAGAAKMITNALRETREAIVKVTELLGRVDVRTEVVRDVIERERSGVFETVTHETAVHTAGERDLSPAEKAAGYGRPATPSRGVRAKTEPGRGR